MNLRYNCSINGAKPNVHEASALSIDGEHHATGTLSYLSTLSLARLLPALQLQPSQAA